ncbi:unnamed protein product [Lymnaea stagnalis]|uniref:RING-type domain-containing protein n=1 Tax=Lymnaea stagnalis TaxID=6523 RepID=A0AAV2IK42_LYMST
MTSGTSHTNEAIRAELELVKQEAPAIENVRLIAAVPSLVRAEIMKTKYKQLTVSCMFQPSYPNVPVVTELRSKTLADTFLDRLSKVCDAEAKKLTGRPQTVHIIKFVKTFIEENPLCVCSEEISLLKKLLTGDHDEIKLKQKTSQIAVKVHQELYFIHLTLSVPETYPLTQVSLQIDEHNFPEFLRVNFQAQAAEIARQCVHPPLKHNPKDPPFKPKSSVLPLCQYIINCVKTYPLEKCPLCLEKVLPADPKNECATKGKQKTVKVYCGHLFHYICLNGYMKTPPFSEGKKCPACSKQIFHEKWKIAAEVMENRWAHKQAKQRELEEVVDFLD